jgi:hypothetical protein
MALFPTVQPSKLHSPHFKTRRLKFTEMELLAKDDPWRRKEPSKTPSPNPGIFHQSTGGMKLSAVAQCFPLENINVL